MSEKHRSITLLCVSALFMAANIVMSSFGVPVPGGHFYLNDIVICTAALLLPTPHAFAVGAIGAFLGDVLFYPLPMFVTLVVRAIQTLSISLCFHRGRQTKLSAILAVTLGAVIMVVGYSLGRAYFYATPEYAILKLPYQVLQAAIGAIISVPLSRRLAGITAKSIGE